MLVCKSNTKLLLLPNILCEVSSSPLANLLDKKTPAFSLSEEKTEAYLR